MRRPLAKDLEPKPCTEFVAIPRGDIAESLVTVEVSDVMQALPEPPAFVIAPWLPRRHVTLFGGHGGTGKSYLALVLAAHVASGDRFADLEVTRGKVLYVSLEDEASVMRYRLRRVLEEYQLNHYSVVENLHILDGTGGDSALASASGDGVNAEIFRTVTYQQVRKEAEGVDLVIIDNASDAFEANENSRRHVRSFIRMLGNVAKENDAAVMLLAHIDKASAKSGSNGNSYSGSTAWHNSCRSRLALVDDEGTRIVVHEKLNVGRRAESLILTANEEGVPIPSGSLSKASDGLGSVDRQDMVACFRVAGRAGLNIPARVTPGNGSAMGALSTLSEYPVKFSANARGRRLASQLLNQMKLEGLLVEEEYTDQNRNRKMRLTLTDAASTYEESTSKGVAGGPE